MFLSKKNFLIIGLTAAFAIAAPLIGCGGGDGSSDSTQAIATSSLSKKQFIERAGAVCISSVKPLLPRLTAYEEKHAAATKRGNEIVLGKAVKAVLPPVLRQQADGIRELGAPRGDESQVEAILVAFEAEAEEIENGPALSSLEELDDKFRQSGKLARQYGLATCAYG